MVPIVAERKQAQKERIGVDRICLYDDKFLFPDGNAKPEGHGGGDPRRRKADVS